MVERPQVQLKLLVKELLVHFDKIFNGTLGGSSNLAEAKMFTKAPPSYRKTYLEKPMIEFRIDSPGPNLHPDWVSLLYVDPELGHAVKTMGAYDEKWGNPDYWSHDDPAHASWFATFADTHFLAGNRSWVLCDAANPLGGEHKTVEEEGKLFFLETAAIERYSSHLYDKGWSLFPRALLPTRFKEESFVTGGSYLPKMRNAITEIWTTLLDNYVAFKENLFRMSMLSPEERHGSPEWKTYRGSRGTCYQFESYPDIAALQAQPWVQEMIKLHPYLEQGLF